MFTVEAAERYSRHILLKEVGVAGQMKLGKGKVLVVGAGGLGSPAAMYLAAAGVGTIGIADADKVDLSNLQRQIIHSTEDVGKRKTLSAKETIDALNPNISVVIHDVFVDSKNIAGIIKDYDFVIDGTDNFSSKFLINDACVSVGKAFSHGGVLRFSGQTMTYVKGAPCLRCIFKNPPEKEVLTCRDSGVLGVVPGVIGTVQACEAVKYLLGAGELLTGKLLIFDALRTDFRKIEIKRDADCTCGDINRIKLVDYAPPQNCRL
ncbi:MAG: HesA/MoeB/ThiF family protein [Clostridiales bacterium]|jgi:molybdopterin/thiamine biosynthesis adenylyltransferase|nr:HesA/MoeB/ThiF family protein [Clostridiales bacterium]